MKWKFTLTIVFLLYCLSAAGSATLKHASITLYKGIVITHSVVIKNKTYHFNGNASIAAAPVIIEGDNITVDFNGAVIEGNANFENPDKFTGTGIIIKKGSNITIKNLAIRGFKVGVMAKGITGLHIIDGNFSNNFRQHLNSTADREDLADWQSYHHNEKDEWLRYGAGIYLRNCDSADIHNNTVIQGQCGLMMTGCNNGVVYNNNFSYNSGLGIGMYRSNGNRVMYNKLDWNVRGFSDGVYYRGQDSASILIFEQSNDNVFAYNSATHSGDGFFLWAGQTTMDTGDGGCNGNIIFSNNFSYAPTNGVELTFSRNKVINNIIHDCWHGVWAGFSYNTLIANNNFANNMSAIAIEHGMDNIIDQNTFRSDKVGIELWSNPKRPKDIGYLKNRDTRSMNYLIRNNWFAEVKNVFNINNTLQVNITNNRISGGLMQQKLDSTVKGIYFDKTGDKIKPVMDSSYFPKITPIPTGQNAMLPATHPQGKKYIIMNEWGPYSFNYPMLRLVKTDSSGSMHFVVMGPAGGWKIVNIKGASNPSALSGSVGGELILQKGGGALTDIDIKMEYQGEEVTSPFGKKHKAGSSYIFNYRKFDIPFQWQMKWFEFNGAADPLKNAEQYKKLLGGTPVKITRGNILSSIFAEGFGKNIGKEKIATVSTADIDVPAGLYRLGISASEITKVYVDDKLVIQNWDPSKIINDEDYHRDAIISLRGKHTLRVEQVQYGSYGMLNFTLQPVSGNK